ncbi:MAG TPA: phage holin family protein [Candidatus Yonathbacteria bacterium]|nr:phage holin family protein [Candidatus Yonathbacteria bacterium]
MSMILRLLITTLALLGVAYFIPGIVVDSFSIAFVVAILLGLVNLILRPIFIVLTLPINILTLGLFTFVINGLLFWFVASFIDGFNVDGLFVAVVGALAVSIVSFVGNKLIVSKEDN